MFVNDKDKIASFSQTVRLENNPLPKGTTLNIYAWVSPVRDATLPGRVKVDVWYNNGKKDKVVLHFPAIDAIGYTQISGNLPLKRPVTKLRVTLTPVCPEFTRPAYSSIRLGLVPTAATTVGCAIKVGMLRLF
jgi:hypothetical protein